MGRAEAKVVSEKWEDGALRVASKRRSDQTWDQIRYGLGWAGLGVVGE